MAITLLSPDDLLHRGNITAFLILDARPYSRYFVGHIPGAVWMGWESWCDTPPRHAASMLAQPGYWGVLRDDTMETLAERLGRFGVSENRPIVVYADGPRSKGREARIAWMLLYWALPSVSLLNGGWSAWLRQGGDVETVAPQPIQSPVHLQLHVPIPYAHHEMLPRSSRYRQR